MTNPLYTPYQGGAPWHLRDNVPQAIYDDINRRFKEQYHLEGIPVDPVSRVQGPAKTPTGK